MNSGTLIFASLLYLAFLFVVAYWAEKQAEKGKSLVTNPYIYALSLARSEERRVGKECV